MTKIERLRRLEETVKPLEVIDKHEGWCPGCRLAYGLDGFRKHNINHKECRTGKHVCGTGRQWASVLFGAFESKEIPATCPNCGESNEE